MSIWTYTEKRIIRDELWKLLVWAVAFTMLVLGVMSAVGAAEIVSTSTSMDPNTLLITFTLQYDSLPTFNPNAQGQIPDSFRITLYSDGTAVSIVKMDEWWYGYGLPVHYMDDPEPLVPGRWKAALRSMSLQPDHSFSFTAEEEIQQPAQYRPHHSHKKPPTW